jgi:hypothetical protein
MKIKELLAKPISWTQGAYARDKDGNGVHIKSKFAISFCLLGAIEYCYDTVPECITILNKIRKELGIDQFTTWNTAWNDAPERTHKDILDLVTKLDI